MIQWEQVRSVFLDMDGTLLDLAFDNYFWHEYVPMQYGKKHDMEMSVAKEYLQKKYRGKAGTMHWYCLDFWSRELGLDVLQLKQSVIERVAVFPGVEEFLFALRSSGKEIVLLTNAHVGGMELKLDQSGLRGHFDRIISSHSVGEIKESAPFWKKLESRHAFDLCETLLIDDNVQVLTAAMNYGLRHLLCISKPDSTQSSQDTGPFKAINSFADIMPVS